MGKLIKGINDLNTLYPHIALQWHPTLNGPVLPDSVAAHSNKKFFWLCEKGHTYDSSPDKRVNGEGCPYCNNRRLLVGFNDLETTYPDIAAEWDYSLNEKKSMACLPWYSRNLNSICSRTHFFCSAVAAGTGSKGCIGSRTGLSFCTSGWNEAYTNGRETNGKCGSSHRSSTAG